MAMVIKFVLGYYRSTKRNLKRTSFMEIVLGFCLCTVINLGDFYMRIKKLVLLILIAAFAFLLLACVPNDGINNASSVKPVGPDVTEGDNSPTKLKWSASKSSHVRIVDGGLHPKSETVTFDFGYDTVGMKKSGYTMLTFNLSFDEYINKGLNVSTTIEAYFTDNKKSEFGVGWSNLRYTNTSTDSRSYTKTIDIDNLLQNRGKIYLTFTAVSNTFQTGTYISNINLTIYAE